MKKRIINIIFFAISMSLLIQMVNAADQGLYLDISEPSPIADRTILINATTNPIAFTVSDSDGGPLKVLCTSSNPDLIPNSDTHINIVGKGRSISVDAEKNEKKHLTARIIPAYDQSGTARLTFKVIDSGGLFATKSMNLTVTNMQPNSLALESYAFVPSNMIDTLDQWLFSEINNIITLSVIGSGQIRMNDQIIDTFQKIMIDPNQHIQIEAQPDENWLFAYWSGDVVDAQNPLNFSPDDQQSIQAVFISKEEEQLNSNGWQLNLFISDNQTPEIPISEISLGVADRPYKMRCNQKAPALSIVTDTELKPLSDHITTETGEQFFQIRITQDTPKLLNWEFDQQNSGSFELLNAKTYEVYVFDLKTEKQWEIPESSDSMDLLIHYMP